MTTLPAFSIPASTGWEDTGSEIVLVSMRDGGVSVLSDSAAEIWRALASNASSAAISADLKQRFPERAATISADVEEFVHDLIRAGLLETGTSA